MYNIWIYIIYVIPSVPVFDNEYIECPHKTHEGVLTVKGSFDRFVKIDRINPFYPSEYLPIQYTDLTTFFIHCLDK